MSKHFEDGQYDDDLTIGVDDFNTDDLFAEVDLLKYKPFESPLAKLKSLVLSIDWEITDDILREFNEELIALREIWINEKIYLVYIQALQTISKYIYQEKSSAHPNAVKFLPAFYYNLEKIVLDDNITEKEKEDILLADVKRFHNLKKQLVEKAAGAAVAAKTDNVLHRLKALVLSIDWEITEADLDELRKEVITLERAYKTSKPKLILLQGIGTLAAYIRHKGANAHADAFTLLHDFYATLERIITNNMSLAEEKENLFVEVGKFNAFKKIISSTISPEALSHDEIEQATNPDELPDDTVSFQPAFADVDDDSVSGFQEDQVAASLDADEDITSRLESFFSDEPEAEVITSDAPFLGDSVEEPADVEVEAGIRLDDIFKDDFFVEEPIQLDKELVLQGVDVETEADDDSEEEALPVLGDEIAPALADNDEESRFSEEHLVATLENDDLGVTVGEDSSLSFIDESSDFGDALTDIDLDDSVEVDDEDNEITSIYSDSEDVSPAPALANFDGESVAETNDDLEFDDELGLESTLDAFFEDFDDTESDDQADVGLGVAGTAVTSTSSEQVNLLKEYFDEDTVDAEDEDDSVDSVDSVLVADESIEDSVDQFFGFGDEEDVVVAALSDSDESEESVVAGALVDTVIDESVDLFFGFADDNEILPELAAEEELGVDGDATVQPVETDLLEDREELVAFLAIDESVPEDTVETVDAVDCFVDLRSSIQSLGIEIETQIINGVFADINQLRQREDATTLEKSLLQLLSTVVQHIDRNRYLSSDLAYDLVLSVFAGLESSMSVSAEKGGQILLAETYKVLQWQQELIYEAQAATTSVEIGGDDLDLGSESIAISAISEGEDELIYAAHEEELAKDSGDGLTVAGGDDIRSELESLRKTLQDEIAQLRTEFLKQQ